MALYPNCWYIFTFLSLLPNVGLPHFLQGSLFPVLHHHNIGLSYHDLFDWLYLELPQGLRTNILHLLWRHVPSWPQLYTLLLCAGFVSGASLHMDLDHGWCGNTQPLSLPLLIPPSVFNSAFPATDRIWPTNPWTYHAEGLVHPWHFLLPPAGFLVSDVATDQLSDVCLCVVFIIVSVCMVCH